MAGSPEVPIGRGALLAAVLAALPGHSAAPSFHIWRLENGALVADAPDTPLAVGSLQKPFVAKAWALTHPGEPSPRFRCGPGDLCWYQPGHGELGLTRATAVSCNTYFLRLAEAVPLPELAAELAAEGFAQAPEAPADAVGLGGALAIRPSALLAAYRNLTHAPWPAGEPLRQEVLAGLREAALAGTAKGLGHRGFWAKTGTVALGPLHTLGFALAVDDAGWAILGRLGPGTGRQAALALAGALDRLRPGAPRIPAAPDRTSASPVPRAAPAQVRVRLFELLGSRRLRLRNLGPDPVPAGAGYLGAGAAMELRRGDTAGPGLLELSAPGTLLVRRIQGEVSRPGPVLATLPLREYVSGVLAGELPHGAPELRIQLGAAVLRFLAQGPRHPDADVCDNTHCALFIGRGPRLDWRNGARTEVGALDDAAWNAIQAAATRPGPDRWTAHCGGRPLSARFVWGAGDPAPAPCPRHSGPAQAWVRAWSAEAVASAFGGSVRRLAVVTEDGVWGLRVWAGREPRTLRFDQAHRLLAAVLGWDALPSPADSVTPAPGGFRAQGVGAGHRVGLCLGD
jgi:hypothetical protein